MERVFFIPGNVPSSKNSKIFTGKFLVWSKAAQKYRKATKPVFENWALQFREELKKHSFPVKVSLHFVRGSRHKFDLINPTQTLFDLMVEHNWIEDDNADVIIPVYEQYTYSKENPGVYIKILNS